jgi:hypothetical protein
MRQNLYHLHRIHYDEIFPYANQNMSFDNIGGIVMHGLPKSWIKEMDRYALIFSMIPMSSRWLTSTSAWSRQRISALFQQQYIE